jgi:YggT family protein
MTLLLASARTTIADYLRTLIEVYIVLIFIRILMSWFPRIPYNRWLAAFLNFVTEVTDPFLNIFRRVIPAARVGPAAIDFSPMIAVIVLILLGGVVTNLIHG